nr:ROK family protein [candidate division KSB1 bacterium]NIR71911.1 ROK family protein [candidate division KSB1 bacterium]NIS23801.1 ROK family protein [candidate division KSB1 bacterium]NIT70724.1 ROK family protein [candidate division KSB1 bacterium]NIU24451.1 ROK family protein [candidate division KSB1 bacterium]
MKVLGIDVGGSGIKGAPVDIKTGDLLGERYRIPTPKAAKPKPIVQTITEMVKHFDWGGPIGCGFPAVIQHGVARSAANIDNSWIGQNVEELLGE